MSAAIAAAILLALGAGYLLGRRARHTRCELRQAAAVAFERGKVRGELERLDALQELIAARYFAAWGQSILTNADMSKIPGLVARLERRSGP